MVPLRGRGTLICRTLSTPHAVPQLSPLVIPGGNNVQETVQKQLELEVLDTSVTDCGLVILLLYNSIMIMDIIYDLSNYNYRVNCEASVL